MSMYKRAFGWFCPKIGATECPFECGGGGLMAIWAMPKWTEIFFRWGFPYTSMLKHYLIQIITHLKDDWPCSQNDFDDQILSKLLIKSTSWQNKIGEWRIKRQIDFDIPLLSNVKDFDRFWCSSVIWCQSKHTIHFLRHPRLMLGAK